MNLTWLDDFLALAASGNFSRAAEERHMTQPAFGRRIRALEAWLGVPLFDRATQPAQLTEAGLWFRTVAQDSLARTARWPDEARAIANASAATLRIAATHALSFTFLPGWLRGLDGRATAGPIQLVSDVMQQCEAAMLQGRVQFLLCHAHEQVQTQLDPAAHESVVVGHDELLPVAAADAGAAGQARYSLEQAGGAAVPLLAYSAESGIGRLVRALRGPALDRIALQPAFTAHLATVLKTMALDGRGVAWLPRSLIREELAEGRLLSAGGAAWLIAVEIRLYRRRARGEPVAEAFWRAASA